MNQKLKGAWNGIKEILSLRKEKNKLAGDIKNRKKELKELLPRKTVGIIHRNFGEPKTIQIKNSIFKTKEGEFEIRDTDLSNADKEKRFWFTLHNRIIFQFHENYRYPLAIDRNGFKLQPLTKKNLNLATSTAFLSGFAKGKVEPTGWEKYGTGIIISIAIIIASIILVSTLNKTPEPVGLTLLLQSCMRPSMCQSCSTPSIESFVPNFF